MYQIYIDKDCGRVEVRFDTIIHRTLTGFEESLKLACMLVRHHAGFFDLLVDYTHSREMTGDVLYNAKEYVAWCVEHDLRKFANITTDPGLRRQIDALWPSDCIKTFARRADAVTWLDGAQILPLLHKRP